MAVPDASRGKKLEGQKHKDNIGELINLNAEVVGECNAQYTLNKANGDNLQAASNQCAPTTYKNGCDCGDNSQGAFVVICKELSVSKSNAYHIRLGFRWQGEPPNANNGEQGLSWTVVTRWVAWPLVTRVASPAAPEEQLETMASLLNSQTSLLIELRASLTLSEQVRKF